MGYNNICDVMKCVTEGTTITCTCLDHVKTQLNTMQFFHFILFANIVFGLIFLIYFIRSRN